MGSIMYMGREYSGVSGVQFSSIPDPTMELLGKIIQYVGPNTRDYANGLFYKCIKNDDIIFWAPISVQAGQGSGETIQYITLPDPTVELAGKIYQYVGPDTSLYTNGYFYKCTKFGSEYKWTKVNVQDGSGSGDTIQYDILPVPSSSLKGKIYQYVGETNTLYTNGYFYKCIENNGMYVWKVVEVSGQEDPRFIQPITYSDELIGQTLTITKGSSTVLETVLDNTGITFYKGYETGTYTYSITEYSISETREYSILDAQYPEINLTTLNYFTQPIAYEEDLIGQTLTVRKGTSVVLEYELDETGVYFFKGSEVGTYEFLVDGAESSYSREYLVLGETYPEIRFTKQELLYFTQPINYTDDLIGKTLTVSKDGSTILETVLDDTKRYLFKGYETGTYTFNIDSASASQTREYTTLDVTYSDISFDILRTFTQPITYDSVYVGQTLTIKKSGTVVVTHVLDESDSYNFTGSELGSYEFSIFNCTKSFNITISTFEELSEIHFDEEDRSYFTQPITYDSVYAGKTLTVKKSNTTVLTHSLDGSGSYNYIGYEVGSYSFEVTGCSSIKTNTYDPSQGVYTTINFSEADRLKFTQPITYDSVYVGQTLTIKKSGTVVLEQELDNSGSYNYEGYETGSYVFSVSLCSKEYTRTINSYQMQSSIHFYESDKVFFTLPIRYDSVYVGQTLTIKRYGTTVLTHTLDNSGHYDYISGDEGNYEISVSGCSAIVQKFIFEYIVLPEIYFEESDRVFFRQPIRYDSYYAGKTLTVKLSSTTVLTKTLDNSGYYEYIGYEQGTYTYTISTKAYTRSVISYSDQPEITFEHFDFVSFETATDEQIADILNKYYSDELTQSQINALQRTYWPVGATRQISLSAMSGVNTSETHVANTYTFAILDHEHDDLTTPINGHTKAFITLGQVEVLTDSGTTPEEGIIGTPYKWFNDCLRRTWCNDVYFNALPSSIRSLVKSVNKYSCDGSDSDSPQLVTTSDKAFLLSVYEVIGSTANLVNTLDTLTLLPEGELYAYYETASNRLKTAKNSTILREWWLRSMYTNWDNEVCYFKSSSSNPYVSHEKGYGRNKSIVPSFCL